MQKIILATTSPHRIEAFRMLGFEFEAVGSGVDEDFLGRPEEPIDLVVELARRKAEAVAQKFTDAIIIGFDSVGWFSGKILEKPKNREDSYERLVRMSKNKFQFLTGICLIDQKSREKKEKVVVTDAFMRKITAREIENYLHEDPNYKNYALGFDALECSSSAFIKKIEGSYNNILRGIPLETVSEMINDTLNI